MQHALRSHVLPCMASATFAGMVEFGLSRSFLFGTCSGGIVSVVYSVAHDILAQTRLGKETKANSLIRHSLAILVSAGATCVIVKAAAIDGLFVMPSMASMGTAWGTAVTISLLCRKFLKIKNKGTPPKPADQAPHKPPVQIGATPVAPPTQAPKPSAQVAPTPAITPVLSPQEIERQKRIERFKNDPAMRTAAPLLAALQQNKEDLAAWLIDENKADVNCQNDKRETPLSVVVSQGKQALAEKLIGKGARLDCIDCEGNRLVHQAVKGGNLELIGKFWNPTTREARNKDLMTPLACAVLAGKLEMARHLRAQGANVQALAKGSNMIHHAVVSGKDAILEWTLTLGLNIDQADDLGYTPLALAVERENREAVIRLKNAYAEGDIKTKIHEYAPIHLAVLTGKGDFVQWLLEQPTGFYFEDRCKLQMTPFALAVSKGYKECAIALLNEGASTDVVDVAGRRILHHAVASKSLDVVRWALTLNDCGRNVQDGQGYTPLLLAAEQGSLEIARCLQEAGEKFREATRDNRSLLHLAASSGNIDLIRWVLTLGLARDATDNQGYTPVQCAIEKGHMDAAQFLIGQGVQ